MNIPKSGWLKRIKEINPNKLIFKMKEKSFLLLYLPRSKELKIINVGLRISVGWKEKLNSFTHLLAPFVSGKKNIVDIDNKIENTKNIIEKIIKFLMDNFEHTIIITRPSKQNIICFFIRRSYFSSILIDMLKIPKIPIIIKKTIGKNIKRSKWLLLIRDENLIIFKYFF